MEENSSGPREEILFQEHSGGRGEPMISGFWRRIGALIVDGIVLSIFGVFLSPIFYDLFVALGAWGRLLGFVIALFYFGVLNSAIGNGQTIGKRILNIMVVDRSGGTIPPALSFIRFLVLGPPYFLNGALIPPDIVMNPLVSLFIGFIVFFVGGTTVYLYICNTRTRQSLHDLLAGTYVVKAQAAGCGLTVSPVWRGHLTVMGLIFASVVLLVAVVFPRMRQAEFFNSLLTVQKKVQNSENVLFARVSSGSYYSESNGEEEAEFTESTYFRVDAVLRKEPSDYEGFFRKIAAIVMDAYPQVRGKDYLVITASYGFDIGITSAWQSRREQHSPGEWFEMLSGSRGKYVALESLGPCQDLCWREVCRTAQSFLRFRETRDFSSLSGAVCG